MQLTRRLLLAISLDNRVQLDNSLRATWVIALVERQVIACGKVSYTCFAFVGESPACRAAVNRSAPFNGLPGVNSAGLVHDLPPLGQEVDGSIFPVLELRLDPQLDHVHQRAEAHIDRGCKVVNH